MLLVMAVQSESLCTKSSGSRASWISLVEMDRASLMKSMILAINLKMISNCYLKEQNGNTIYKLQVK